MKNKTPQNTNAISGVFVLILAGLVTSSLIILKYFKIINLGFEVALAPLLVIALLAFGDKLIMVLFLKPINFFYKFLDDENSNSHAKQQHLTFKESSYER